MGMFKKGYTSVREEKQRQDEAREKAGKNLFRFFLTGDGDEADVRFLTEEPVTFYEHTIKGMRGGKEVYDTHICSGDEDCPLCKNGDKPTFKGAFLIWDKRPFEYTDKDNKKQKGEGQLRLYVQGARVLSQLDRISTKYGLTNRTITIVRLGKGTSTSYTIEKGDEEGKLSQAEIKNMLPEKLRESYNGTMDSLYNIVEECLSNSLATSEGNSSDDDDEEYKGRSNLVGLEDEEEETVRTPRPSGLKKKSPMFKSARPKENSVKPMFRKK